MIITIKIVERRMEKCIYKSVLLWYGYRPPSPVAESTKTCLLSYFIGQPLQGSFWDCFVWLNKLKSPVKTRMGFTQREREIEVLFIISGNFTKVWWKNSCWKMDKVYVLALQKDKFLSYAAQVGWLCKVHISGTIATLIELHPDKNILQQHNSYHKIYLFYTRWLNFTRVSSHNIFIKIYTNGYDWEWRGWC